jgi:hypothetical protein
MWIISVAQPIASSKEKEDLERWIVWDVGNIWRWGVAHSPSQAPKRRQT